MPWRPENKYIGDFWFASKGDVLHLFYLQADINPKTRDPEVRKWCWSIGHAVADGNSWSVLSPGPVFAARTTDNTWDNLTIWTGSIIEEHGLHYMFYTAMQREEKPLWTPLEWRRPQNIGLAVSKDLNTWQRAEHCLDKPLIANPGTGGIYDGVAFRDPYVIKFGDTFYCFICARLVPDSKTGIQGWDEGGAIVYLSSKSLTDWSDCQPQILVASRHFYQMEVPQVFWKKISATQKVLYLLFCAAGRDCSKLRRNDMPDNEIVTGTFFMCSEPVPHDFDSVPPFLEPARILAPHYYAGRILDDQGSDESMSFFGQITDTAEHYFRVSIDGPLPVRQSAPRQLSLEKACCI